jgi:hypothetical protein
MERFVRVRGGGFMMKGGRSAFSLGGFAGTPIADVLPVELYDGFDPGASEVFTLASLPPIEQGFAFRPTEDGFDSPILKLSPDAEINRARWSEMPGLTSLNRVGPVKPGATVLAEKPDDDLGEGAPLLVVHRYGRGRAAALTTASSWRWQMLLDADDQRHARFWRQLARWLAGPAPDRVTLEIASDRVEPGREIPLGVRVFDEHYTAEEGARVQGLVSSPFGTVRELTFEPDLSEAGVYRALAVLREEGVHEVETWAEVNGERVGRSARSVLVRPSLREFHDATQKRTFLESLARAANGWYYEPGGADRIEENIRSRRTSTSIYRAEYLWDMPLLFVILLALLSAEWIYRRRKGLP